MIAAKNKKTNKQKIFGKQKSNKTKMFAGIYMALFFS